jgi:predicted O-methyltransferase YrrM
MKRAKVGKSKKGILLDVGCKDRKQLHWFGMDWRQYAGVDLIHDLEKFPYPLESESCLTIKAAHCIEHISPKLWLSWMDEMWRLLKPEGQLALSMPYAGSPGYLQDPTHVTAFTEKSWQYVDPDFPMYMQYTPRPWKIEAGYPMWQVGGNLEVVLRKRPEVNFETVLAHRAVNLGALQKPSELAALIGLLRPIPLETVVEIGTARGGVFYALCQVAREEALVVSIDLPGGQFGGGYTLEDQQRFVQFGRGHQQLAFLRNDSHLAITKQSLKRLLNGREIDFLFIDGDHTYKGVKKDYEMYSPLVRRGGLIAFHDICFHPTYPTCEVERFWKEIKVGKHAEQCIDLKDAAWGGIGVIWKN